MQIDVIDVSKPAFTKTDKGGYNKIEVAYKEGGKVTGKQLVDFGKGKSVYDFFIANPKPGSVVITTEKDGKYINWTAVATAAAGSSNQSQESEAPPATTGTGSRGRVTGSNGTKELEVSKVIEIAKQYEAYVFGKDQPNAVSETYQGEPVPVG
jgi:hypothetical protein